MSGALRTRYIDVTVSTPVATLRTAPQSTAFAIPDLQVISAHLTIPAGHTYLTGWRIDLAGVTIVPYSNPSAWVIDDDAKLDFDIDHEVGSRLEIVTYNIGQYPHTHYCRLKVMDILPDDSGRPTVKPLGAF